MTHIVRNFFTGWQSCIVDTGAPKICWLSFSVPCCVYLLIAVQPFVFCYIQTAPSNYFIYAYRVKDFQVAFRLAHNTSPFLHWRIQTPLPFLLPYPPILFPSSFLPLPSLFPLEVGLLNTARRSGRVMSAPPSGVWNGTPAEIEFSAV